MKEKDTRPKGCLGGLGMNRVWHNTKFISIADEFAQGLSFTYIHDRTNFEAISDRTSYLTYQEALFSEGFDLTIKTLNQN